MTHIPRPTAPRLPALADPGADVADLLATLVVGDGSLPNILGVMGRLVQMYIHRGQKESLTRRANVLFEMLWRAISKPARA